MRTTTTCTTARSNAVGRAMEPVCSVAVGSVDNECQCLCGSLCCCVRFRRGNAKRGHRRPRFFKILSSTRNDPFAEGFDKRKGTNRVVWCGRRASDSVARCKTNATRQTKEKRERERGGYSIEELRSEGRKQKTTQAETRRTSDRGTRRSDTANKRKQTKRE